MKEPGRVACRPSGRRHLRWLVLLAAASLAIAPAAIGAPQDEPELVTDRPDQTESTAIVPAGRVQIELGANLVSAEEDDVEVEERNLPGTLARIGLTERFELRVGWIGWLEEEVEAGGQRERDDGFGDASLGAKVRLREGAGLSPAIALLGGTTVPVGDEGFSSERFDPSMRVSISHDLDGGIGLGYNVGVDTDSRLAADGHRSTLASAIYTLSAGFPAGERAGVFIEVFGDVPLSAGGGPAHLFDGGVTYLLRPNLQLDAAGGVGLSDDAPDWFAGVGVSMRLPR